MQYVPLPVVGGYLGYVGYFCVAGGVGLGTATQARAHTCISASILYIIIIHPPIALPSSMVVIGIGFHFRSWGTHHSGVLANHKLIVILFESLIVVGFYCWDDTA